MKVSLTAYAALALLAAPHAGAAITTFTDRAAFDAAIAGADAVFFEDFENLGPGGSPTRGFIEEPVGADGQLLGPVNGLSFFGDATRGNFNFFGGDVTNGLGSNAGPQSGNDPLTLTFPGGPVTAFGTDLLLTDQEFAASDGTITTTALSVDGHAASTLSINPYGVFVGFVSDTPLASITLTPAGVIPVQSYVTIDDTVVAAIPEPASAAFLGLAGLGLLGFRGRRRLARA